MFLSFLIHFLALITTGDLSGSEDIPLPNYQEYQSQNIDSSEIANIEEDDFQERIDSLFEDSYSDIDTFGWSNVKVNSAKIDCSYLFDTVRIELTSEAKEKYYVHPFMGKITSNFGRRESWLWHYGVDLKLNKGDTVLAAFDGIVRAVTNDRHGYGRVVVIRHCWGLETIYGHLSKLIAVANQKVKAGDVIGLGGNTGRSSGSHLHYEMRYYGEAFDPNLIIDFEKCMLKSDTLKLYKDNFAHLKENRKAVRHRIQKGDNLGKIARRYGTSVNKLCRLNGITPKSILKIGRQLVVRTGE